MISNFVRFDASLVSMKRLIKETIEQSYSCSSIVIELLEASPNVGENSREPPTLRGAVQMALNMENNAADIECKSAVRKMTERAVRGIRPFSFSFSRHRRYFR